MSAYPRIVLTSVWVSWDPAASGIPNKFYVRAGTCVDIKPGSALEAAYGGASNLSGVIPPSDPRRSPDGSGAKQLAFTWDGGGTGAVCQDTLLAGQVIMMDPVAGGGQSLYNAIGASNLTALTGTLLNNDQTGSDGSSTANA